uniref:Mixed-linked glucanase n=1 Tax=Ganoderma boninense TaxID=34458 RepID=A0A5K1JXN3_9APHY|nr:Mixed-linked glucanase [Ganoderma boninense]
MSHLEKASSELAANPPPALYSASTSTSHPQYYRKLGNPVLFVGMALFVGGLAQFVAGMWEFACQNTFGATAFTMFGGFWMSFGTIFIPGSGVLDAYVTNGVLDAAELNSALGIYLWTWFMITFLLLCVSLSRSLPLFVWWWCLALPVSLSPSGTELAVLSRLRVSA